MGLAQAHALGIQTRVFVALEGATPNVLVKAAPAAALRVKSSSVKETTPREPRADARDTRSQTERITRATEVEWSLSAYLLTGNDPGDVTSRLHPLLYALFGTYTNTPGVSDVYSLSSTQVPRSLSIVRQPLEGNVQESAIGAVVNQGVFSLSAGDEPMVEFSGPALRYAQAIGTSTIPAGATSATQTVADGSRFAADSVVYFTDSGGGNIRNNTSAGYRITAVSGNVLTLEASLTTANNDIVLPFTPTPTNVGTPIAGILGALTLDAVAVPIKSFTLTLANTNQVITEALQANATDHVFGERVVTGSITVRARADQVHLFARRKTFTARDLDIVCGAAGNRYSFSLPTIEVDATGEMNLPVGQEEGDFELPFTALGTGENEITLTLD